MEILGEYDYLIDLKNCNHRKDTVRYFKILEKEFTQILDYIELNQVNMKTYSLKIHELFLTICVEIEDNLKGILYANNYNVNKNLNMKDDYFKLNEIMKLSQYKTKINLVDSEQEFCPFKEWNDTSYKQLKWYNAYNLLKHNRSKNIQKANLENLINAISALYIILYAQFYRYANVLNSEGCIFVTTEDGDFIAEGVTQVIRISREPQWNENEKYEFDWERIKDKSDSFSSIY